MTDCWILREGGREGGREDEHLTLFVFLVCMQKAKHMWGRAEQEKGKRQKPLTGNQNRESTPQAI